MVRYQEFSSLAQSSDSEDRGQAAHLAALAYLSHQGPADEHAALYAALIGFLDDPSVKVRAALAYGLLHSPDAPRPIMLALLQESAVIARAVIQYSPVLIDADFIRLVPIFDLSTLVALSQRHVVSRRVATALIARNEPSLTLRLLRRADVDLGPDLLSQLAAAMSDNAEARGALLARKDLPADARLLLINRVTDILRQARVVKGALAPDRLARVLRDSGDTALSQIGEREAGKSSLGFVSTLIETDQVTTRVLLHAVLSGHVLFFSDCLSELAQAPRAKVYAVLESGSRSALSALLSRCGLSDGVRGILVRMIEHARATDLADDVAARHYVVTVLTEELIAEHDGVIPEELEEAFAYISEQNITLARKAARGVMAAFISDDRGSMTLLPEADAPLALPAA
jgi:uncharacterized protein (DUF2336 family)